MEELIKLSEPLRKYIHNNYDMKCAILVTLDEIKVIRDEEGVKINDQKPVGNYKTNKKICGRAY